MNSIIYNIKNKEQNSTDTFYDILSKDIVEVKNIALCKLNGKYNELRDIVNESGKIETITFNTEMGLNIYTRTLQFIFIKATLDLFPNSKIKIEHSISKGLFGEIIKEKPLSEEDIKLIKEKMKEIISKDVPINSIRISKNEAINIFKKYGMEDKISLLQYSNLNQVKLYELEGRYDYFYGHMAYSTGVIRAFDLIYYESGFILRSPEKENLNELPQYKEERKLRSIFFETEKWLSILDIGEVGTLNEKLSSNEAQSLILTSEALHEKKIANIADQIANKKDSKIVLIAGPSSSGKTTFANRLSIQLKVNGLIPQSLSLDDYFVERVNTPRDENGDYDYESIYALDLELINKSLTALMNGEVVDIPTYNFFTGKREWNGNKIKLHENGVLILEGIHGLNPILTSGVDQNKIFKVYISALTQLNLDNHNRISTTDVRKVRRIVRDSLSRGHDAEATLKMWPSIKKGEKNNIFVYQDQADAMFNSTLVYELGLLKPHALKELNKVKEESPVYAEAARLKSILNFFKEVDSSYIPMNSILREFIGGSCFYEY
ncbi:nucleoside kinase [Clostridium botulinum]|uniref:Threonyl-tRNA synthetase/uridine kinase n=1 Tax=Clostridium botulinum (strain Eklund 17B / Type B) TaxID=935198 RepID=B2TQ19_CLOBB|nr:MULTISPECIES: nucleoside kinase [unclassified Clostridium]ACD23296.1 putative threonyl-tRNA synthetase/uridine kinase [Clostridium botulinum B str. Eklund 17B (NRP)]KFX56857.1 ATPase AAA [Clostridium botulinum]MBN1053238.1 nucleoside kinase [Clostridium botulinum]MBY6802125.1 nucleoside kinase [Clostridium botulinum]MBY6812265.1 nucleoside kinase [Clostridium botulinum]